MVPVKVGLGSRAVAAVSGLRPCKKAPDRLFDGKVVVLQHLITGVNLRCGLTAGGVAGIALSECLMRLVQRGVQAGGLLLRKAPGSAHVERDFDEDLERGIREDDGARIAAIGHDAVHLRLLAKLLHPRSQRGAHLRVIGDFGNRSVDRWGAQLLPRAVIIDEDVATRRPSSSTPIWPSGNRRRCDFGFTTG